MITFECLMDYSKPSREQMYYAVSMYLSDNSTENKLNGYSVIQSINKSPENDDHSFYVYIDSKNKKVIADQYMWYQVYSWLDKLISDNIEQYAPCKAIGTYYSFFTDNLNNQFAFPADCSVPLSEENYKDLLSSTKGTIVFCVKKNENVLSIYKWSELVSKLMDLGLSGFDYGISVISAEDFSIVSETKDIVGIQRSEIISIKE